MKKTIKKILKESEEEWGWTQENHVDVPLQDIVDWCENNRTQIAGWIQKIDEFYKNTPQMIYDDNDEGMTALSVISIGHELKNIYSSFDTIQDEINYIQNPEKYND